MSRTLVVVAVLAVFALAACSEQEPSVALEEQVPADQRDEADGVDDADGAPAPDGDVVELVAGDIYYENEPSELPAGTTTFSMENEGNLPHDLVLEELGDRTIVPELQGGETGQGEVDLDPGEYTFYCSIPGHRAAGMEFEVTVDG